MVLDGAALADKRFDDNGFVTMIVGSYKANPWHLHDMHGNVAEWTLSSYEPYPYKEEPTTGVKEERQSAKVTPKICQTCKNDLTYVPSYNNYYCYRCGDY